jgi:hypothetical protein
MAQTPAKHERQVSQSGILAVFVDDYALETAGRPALGALVKGLLSAAESGDLVTLYSTGVREATVGLTYSMPTVEAALGKLQAGSVDQAQLPSEARDRDTLRDLRNMIEKLGGTRRPRVAVVYVGTGFAFAQNLFSTPPNRPDALSELTHVVVAAQRVGIPINTVWVRNAGTPIGNGLVLDQIAKQTGAEAESASTLNPTFLDSLRARLHK